MAINRTVADAGAGTPGLVPADPTLAAVERQQQAAAPPASATEPNLTPAALPALVVIGGENLSGSQVENLVLKGKRVVELEQDLRDQISMIGTAKTVYDFFATFTPEQTHYVMDAVQDVLDSVQNRTALPGKPGQNLEVDAILAKIKDLGTVTDAEEALVDAVTGAVEYFVSRDRARDHQLREVNGNFQALSGQVAPFLASLAANDIAAAVGVPVETVRDMQRRFPSASAQDIAQFLREYKAGGGTPPAGNTGAASGTPAAPPTSIPPSNAQRFIDPALRDHVEIARLRADGYTYQDAALEEQARRFIK